MKHWLLVAAYCLLALAPTARAQNWNAVAFGTYHNYVKWSEADAKASLQAAATSTAPYGSPTCVAAGWRMLPYPNSHYSGHQYTREMAAYSVCTYENGQKEAFMQAMYDVYTCDNVTSWVFDKYYGNWYCEAGYYLALPPPPASGGDCNCDQGRVATAHPIEVGTGNMTESAMDFASGDGRLTFARHYNSNPSLPDVGITGWQNEYAGRHLYPISRGSMRPNIVASDGSSISSVYSSAAAACVQGMADIVQGLGATAGNSAYAGVTATYLGSGQCMLSNGDVVPILNTGTAQVIVGNITDASTGVTVLRPDGASYHFACKPSTCVSYGQSKIALVMNSSGYALTAENGDVESYDVNGNLQQIVGRDSYTRTLTYNTSSSSDVASVSTVTDSRGRVLSLTYNDNGQLNQLTLPDGTWVKYGYEPLGGLASVGYADGSSVGYKYESANFPKALTAWVDESQQTYATWTYDNTTGAATASALAGNVDTSTLVYSGNATTLTDNLGTQRTYNFQTVAGGTRLVSVSGPVCRDCMGQNMTYDPKGFLKTAQDWNGVTTSYSFDATGMLQQKIDSVGTATQRTTNFTWNTALRVPLTRTVIDANNHVVSSSSWVYNSTGQVLARCEIDASSAGSYACAATGSTPAGVSRWTYIYCNAVDGTQCPVVGLLLSVTGPRTDVTGTTQYGYYMGADESGCGTAGGACHRAGDLYQVTDALGHVTTIVAYDKNGRVARQRDANGVLTDFTYHPRGWLVTRTVRANADGTPSANDAITQIGYKPYGAVESITDPDGVKVTYTYDPAHRLTDITDALGNRIHYTLDAAGNKTKEETFDTSGTLRRSLGRTYNTLGQLTGIKDGLNRTVFDASFSDSYDGNGNLVRSADALGIQRKQGYDALNRLITTIDNYNGTDTATQNTQSVFAYDARDQLQGVSDPDGLNTTYDYDGLGNTTAVHSPDTGTSTYVYDAAGNRTQATDARGVVSHSTYDALNRLTATTYPHSDANVSYRYDEPDSVTGCVGSYPIGRLTSIVEAAVTTVYCYDARGNVVQKRQTQGTNVDTVSYTYTLADRLASTRTPDGTSIQYGRDGAGRINAVTVLPPGTSGAGAGNVVTNVSYLPFGPIASYTLGNGQTITRTYDANYAVTDVVSPVLNLHFARDAMGNITALGDAPGANPAIETYSYDPLYRLTGFKDAQGQAIEAYTYNKTGDRLSKTGNGLATGAYAYQAGTHWLTSIGNSARTYDANGNATGRASGGDTFDYGYNDRNRMTVVQRNGQTVGAYTYNAMGQRIAKVASATQRFAYDESSQLIGEYGAANRVYIWLDNLPIAVVDGSGTANTVSYVHADGLNTPRVVSDATGSSTWQWGYRSNPFGEAAATSAGQNLNLRFPGQYFDLETGLHQNMHRDFDSISGRYVQSDPLGMIAGAGTYSYVDASPLRFSDPLGLFLFPWESPIYVEGGTTEEQRRVIDAVNKVFSTRRGKEMLDAIKGPWYRHGSPKTIHITAGHIFRSDFLGGDNMYIDPTFSPCMYTTAGIVRGSLERGIGHELGHLVFGVGDDGPGRMNNVNQNENPVANDLGQPSRTKYEGP